jgi:hypothetical protein
MLHPKHSGAESFRYAGGGGSLGRHSADDIPRRFLDFPGLLRVIDDVVGWVRSGVRLAEQPVEDADHSGSIGFAGDGFCIVSDRLGTLGFLIYFRASDVC